MSRFAGTAAALALAAAAGLAFRLPALDVRPMHGDEAIQALKTVRMLETGRSEHDPGAYHGPTLGLLTLPVLGAAGVRSAGDATESMLRLVPALCGAGTVVLAFGLVAGIGLTAAASSALLLAFSPLQVYYARYYVQESTLVFFTAAAITAGWLHAATGRRTWLYAAAVFAGLMLATKETALIALASLGVAILLAPVPRVPVARVALAAVTACGVAAFVLTSGFRDTGWLGDAWGSSLDYLRLGAAGGDHAHTPGYYLRLMGFARPLAGGPWWSEAAVLALAALGTWDALVRRRGGAGSRRLRRTLGFYALFMTGIYSAIPYKTPWCAMGVHHALVLAAGLGVARLAERMPRWVLASGFAAALAHLGWQARLAAFVYPADRRNPYVYAHASQEVVRLGALVERLAGASGEGRRLPVKVIVPDPWPLPWYLRRLDRVGYWREVPEDPRAPVVIVASPLEEAVRARLEGRYHGQYFGIRPPEIAALLVREGLWKRAAAQAAESP